jgi:hypothetical protein
MFSTALWAQFKRVVIGEAIEPSPASSPSATAAPPSQAAAEPVQVGTGAPNERLVSIAGVPHLFRDEGTLIAHFYPAFASQMRDTPFGVKLLPDMVPHWELRRTYPDMNITDVVAVVLREASGHRAEPEQPSHQVEQPAIQSRPESPGMDSEPKRNASVAPRQDPSRTDRPRGRAAYRGVIRGWGDRQFPERDKPEEFYTSFAIVLDVDGVEQIVQGEGLKEAISESGCKIGNRIQARKIRQVEVPAVKKDGSPLLDKHGVQKMWKKWIWSISIS